MDAKNVFDYLEISFKKIFSHSGQYTIRSSYIVGIVATILKIVLWVSFFWNGYRMLQMQTLDSPHSVCMVFILLLIICVFFLESSFYRIVLPKKFQSTPQAVGGNFLENIGMTQDYILWKNYLKQYIYYITLRGLIDMSLFLVFTVVGILLFIRFPSSIFLYIIGVLWIYIYVSFRLFITWYGILLSGRQFGDGWKILKGKVWRTIKIVCIFSWITGLASYIPIYIAQLLSPDISEGIMRNVHQFQGNISQFQNNMGYIGNFQVIISNISSVFQGFYFSTGEIYKIILGACLFLLILKIGDILYKAMIYNFMADYFTEKEKEYGQ